MNADIYDALNLNTRATGNWGKKKAPKIEPRPRPGRKKSGKKKVTLTDLFARFAGGAQAGG
jgi:hypothetical protein